MPDIFVSYSRDDQAVARRFADAFAAAALDVWWDATLRSGEAYDEVTENALRTAKAVVVLWSKKSVTSRWVRAEATLADRNKTLVPVMIEVCERPIMFELTQTADLIHWRGAADDGAWRAFLDDVLRFVGREISAASVAPPAPADPILAVLPFDNLSTDAEMQFFSDGVSEEIIQRLARGAAMKVIGRTSSFQFRGAEKAGAASALRATHVLDGSIRRAGARVRIAAHLVEAASQTTLWSDRYDRGLDDVFAVQDEISEQIAAALDSAFTSRARPSVDPALYDVFLRASPKQMSPDELRTNIGLLEIVTARAPGFAEGWGRLAYQRAYLRTYHPFSERAQIAARVREESARALALDPHNVDALTGLFLITPPYGAFGEAEAAIERLRAAGAYGEGQMFVGWHARAVGRLRESAVETERMFQLDALNANVANITALARMASGDIEAAVPLWRDLLIRTPDMSYPVANLMRAYAFQGDWGAVDALLDPAAKRPLRQFEDGLSFIAAKRQGTSEAAAAYMARVESEFAQTGATEISRLVYAAHLGRVDDVYDLIARAPLGPRGGAADAIGPDGYRTGLLFWRCMPEIRNDPRFAQLCARLGLVDFWIDSGKWPDCAEETPYDFRAACLDVRDTPREPYVF